ncbi:MAG: tetratricopeptide repeat protein [Bacteroidales bacterium]|nr:tetratricopeptide repeat protein [Bacteroidales bacterium]
MKLRIIAIAALCSIALMSCRPNHDSLVQRITDEEQQLSMIDVAADDSKAENLIGLYEKFVRYNAADTLSPIYLSRAADIAANLGQTDRSIAILDRVINDYPDYSDLAGCYFMKGYAYDLNGQYDLAREAYAEFVEMFPDHYLASDTRKLLPFIGMSAEDMLNALLDSSSAEQLADMD